VKNNAFAAGAIRAGPFVVEITDGLCFIFRARTGPTRCFVADDRKD
jgi:hypothetical protein